MDYTSITHVCRCCTIDDLGRSDMLSSALEARGSILELRVLFVVGDLPSSNHVFSCSNDVIAIHAI